MNLVKILRVYLAFILSITAMSFIGYNDTAKQYLASVIPSVLHSSDAEYLAEQSYSQAYDFDSFLETVEANYVTGEDSDFSFSIMNGAGTVKQGYVAEIMRLKFIADSEMVHVRSLRLKVKGADPDLIIAAYVELAGQHIKGRAVGQYIEFSGLDLTVTNSWELPVKVLVAPDATPGTHFRLDIEKPDDLKLTLDGDEYQIPGYYPLKGKYLSIVKSREWGPWL